MTFSNSNARDFPQGLLDWAGHRKGGVRRLFYDGAGRPSDSLIETPLLQRLRSWAADTASGKAGTPHILLLVGGPGNGKTEAIEETIKVLDDELGVGTAAQDQLRPLFDPIDGSTVPRLARVLLKSTKLADRSVTLTLVQDASLADPKYPGKRAAELLADDMERAMAAGRDHLYIACINRGVLDGALIAATESGMDEPRRLLEAVVRASGIDPQAPRCWPLEGHADVAVWPMDVESLVAAQSSEPGSTTPSPAAQVLALALAAERWPEHGACPAGNRCPYCLSHKALTKPERSKALLEILRWYELASGKRWSFRDLLSLTSFVLAGAPNDDTGAGRTPCESAAYLAALEPRTTGTGVPLRLAAPYLLVAAQFQHALFGEWPRVSRQGLKQDLRDLELHDDMSMLGLHHFLTMERAASIPITLRTQLASLCEFLDPALADPDEEIAISSSTKLRLGDIDARFSYGVRYGLDFVKPYHALTALEINLLNSLAAADERVGSPAVRRRKPATAARLQMLLRDFSCRLVRRSLCVRAGVVRGDSSLRQFAQLVSGDDTLQYKVGKQVEALLNQNDRFIVDLNTTFGEPTPPASRRVWLATQKQKVKPLGARPDGRPRSDVRFLQVGSEASKQLIVLTYELFRSVTDLQSGMTAASLPRPVKAALDAARARLGGIVVRDEDQLDGAEIHIGLRDEVIVREMDKFIVTRSGAS